MPSNPKALADLLVKVDRAYKHIIDLNAETLRFLGEGGPYQTIFEDDPNTGERTYYLRVLKETPPQFSAFIGDIAQNLRSSLDHLAWHLVQTSPVTPKAEDRDIYFPIFESAAKYKSCKMRKIQGMTDAAIKAIDRIEPYYYTLDGPGMGQGQSFSGSTRSTNSISIAFSSPFGELWCPTQFRELNSLNCPKGCVPLSETKKYSSPLQLSLPAR